ncbi:hypothetical protein KO507_02795 [Gilvimarinus agarilyticus]|uniref:protein YgfX n=1 Tax=unclassified Gilvimarinus TaxID=2642066 RepID=UPI001C088625|nr:MULTISPECIES: protein YgfX [unclassified Gilvimarinus]MBU2884687.1 hypothetical protein [Gilvimarinus agarilyticus]MDO6569795.1 hypothetical protein [Gilvimarinus sp. 2_MG-2023]MDO6747391.1 hypothetical protein [Gilvimarinus sp. 1_MG-2023]
MSEKIPEKRRKASATSPPLADPGEGVYLDTTLFPSRILLSWHLAVHSLAGFALLVVTALKWQESAWWLICSGLLVVVVAVVGSRGRGELKRIWHLRLEAGSWFLAPEGGHLQPVRLKGKLTLWPGLVGLSLSPGRGSTHLLLAPDSMAHEDYHRLRVWLVTQVQH